MSERVRLCARQLCSRAGVWLCVPFMCPKIAFFLFLPRLPEHPNVRDVEASLAPGMSGRRRRDRFGSWAAVYLKAARFVITGRLRNGRQGSPQPDSGGQVGLDSGLRWSVPARKRVDSVAGFHRGGVIRGPGWGAKGGVELDPPGGGGQDCGSSPQCPHSDVTLTPPHLEAGACPEAVDVAVRAQALHNPSPLPGFYPWATK